MKQKTKETMGYLVNGLSIALFFYLAFTLDVPSFLGPLRYVGWILLASGVAFVALSIVALAGNRGAGLVDRGVYGIVRHPMYVGAILCFLSYSFFVPHWLILLISAANIAIVYAFILQEEAQNIERFGSPYLTYMETVPRANPVAGILGRMRSK
jgi:protein-S-isoprenylcysteine O-methyltransferase Ste14